MEDNFKPAEIIDKLKIDERSFYRYQNKILKEDARLWEKHDWDNQNARAMQMLKALEECRNVNRSIMYDTKVSARDRSLASKYYFSACGALLKLSREGPNFNTDTFIPDKEIDKSKVVEVKAIE